MRSTCVCVGMNVEGIYLTWVEEREEKSFIAFRSHADVERILSQFCPIHVVLIFQ